MPATDTPGSPDPAAPPGPTVEDAAPTIPLQATASETEGTDSLAGSDDGAERVRLSRLVRRQRIFLAVAVVAALVCAGGLGAATLIKSPAEQAADTAAPPTTLLTSQVTEQVLTSTVILRGNVYPGREYRITPTAASADVKQLVTSRVDVQAGASVAAGEVLAEVSGQPLFVLPGAVPAYRDIVPGATGPDVVELQAALAGLGYGSGGDATGFFGSGTKTAVRAYYQHIGYVAPTTGQASDQAVQAAQRQVQQDEQTIANLETASQDGTRPAAWRPTSAHVEVVDANGAGSTMGPVPGGGSTTPPSTSGSGATTGGSVAQQLGQARQQLMQDEQALAAAVKVDGPMVPMGEVVFIPSLPATVTAVNGQVGMPVSGPLVDITTGGLTLTGQLDPSDAGLVKPGMVVQILSETTGRTATGTVASLGQPTTAAAGGDVIAIGGGGGGGSSSGTSGSGGGGASGDSGGQVVPGGGGGAQYIPMVVTPSAPLDPSFNGQNVRITVQTASTGSAVLTVPVAAVFTTASGRTQVTRVDAGNVQVPVEVTTGASANGYVQVTPVDGTLKPGDRVAVGQ